MKTAFSFPSLTVHSTQYSEDGTIKVGFKTFDGHLVEGVLIPTSSRTTACVSSQVGCSLDCKFCATGYLKRERNLSAAEIIDQIRLINDLSLQHQGKNLDNLTDKTKTDLINVSSPRLVEISLGNTCDLKCMYCNAIFSSQWAVEDLKFNDVSKNYFDNANNPTLTDKMETLWWDWFDSGVYDDADAVGLIGGEPLIIDKTYEYIQKILDKCKLRKKSWPLTISIVTNLNTPEIYFNKLLDIIPNILNTPNVILDLSVSAESLGDRAEFIRTGLKWSRLDKNMRTLLKIAQEHKGKIHFSFMIAINALCVSTFPEFIKWVIELQETYGLPINLRGSQVVYPLWLSPTILNEEYAKFISEAKELVDLNKLSDKEYLYGTWSDYSNQLTNVIKDIKK